MISTTLSTKNDKRRELLVTVFTDLKTGRLIDWLAESEWNKPIMNKYPADPSTDGSVSGNDFIIIRWAGCFADESGSIK